MKLYELAYMCRLYPIFADYDRSLDELRRKTAGHVNVRAAAHRLALFDWLRSWGCRQFAKAYTGTASRTLTTWAERWMANLPRETAQLTSASDVALDQVSEAYGHLKEGIASYRRLSSGRAAVTFGPTGAAKVLFALRPTLCPPWDDPIREELGYDGSRESYQKFLTRARREIVELMADAERRHVPGGQVPRLVGRPRSTLPKLMDEYYWVRITQGVSPPTREEMRQWTRWAGE